jgi:hypothetical protein
MLKKVIALLLFISQAQAAVPNKEISSLKSYQLIKLARGFEAAQINATDVYMSAFDVRSVNSIKDLKKYAEKITMANLNEVVVSALNKNQLAYDLAESLMSGDRYSDVNLRGIGELVQPLRSSILGSRNLKLFWGSSSEERFNSSHNVVVVFDIDSKEVLILSVGYSE